MANNKLKKVFIKNRKGYYFDDIIRIKDLDFDNTLTLYIKLWLM